MADKHPGDGNKGNGETLMSYWVTGPGAARIRWSEPGDYLRCVRALDPHVGDAHGLCNVLHRRATGASPGREDHHSKGK